MAAVAILVNGLPGSGKTTIGASLAEVLGCPFLSKDAVADPLADIVGPMIPPGTLGGIAMDTLWAMAGAVEAGVVVDAVWLPTRDRAHLEQGIVTAGSPRIVELWCDVDRATALERLRDRFEPGAESLRPARGELADVVAFWDEHESVAGPMGPVVGNPWPVVRVDTTADFDVPELVQEIAAHFV